jgi:hypothetical protein
MIQIQSGLSPHFETSVGTSHEINVIIVLNVQDQLKATIGPCVDGARKVGDGRCIHNYTHLLRNHEVIFHRIEGEAMTSICCLCMKTQASAWFSIPFAAEFHRACITQWNLQR